MVPGRASGIATGGAEAVAPVALGAGACDEDNDKSCAVAGATAFGAIVGGCVDDVDVGVSGDSEFGAAGRCRSTDNSTIATNIKAKVTTPHLITDRCGVPGLAASVEDDAVGAEESPPDQRASLARAPSSANSTA